MKIQRTCGSPPSYGRHVLFCAGGSFNFKKSCRKKMGHAFYVSGDTRRYLELVTSLSSDGCLLILRRFIGLYGQPASSPTTAPTSSETSGSSKMVATLMKIHMRRSSNTSKTTAWSGNSNLTGCRILGRDHEIFVESTKRALYASFSQTRHKTHQQIRWQ